MQDQIATLNSTIAALTVQLNRQGDKPGAQQFAPSQQAVQSKIPGMSMKLPIEVPLFSGTGDQEFRTWIKLFERSTRACKVTAPADLLSSLDVYLTGPAARVFQNVQERGVNTYEGMKMQLAEQFKSSALVRNASMSFLNRTQRVGERVVEFATDLWNLADEAYSDVGPDRIDFLLRDRFISGVLPEIIRACEFDHCTSFQTAFNCARRVEERILTAQAAQKLQGQSPTPIRSMSEIPRNFPPANFSLGIGSEIDTFRQEWKDSQKELLDSVRATIEGSWDSKNTGQNGDGGRGNNRTGNKGFRPNYRWTEDGSPICSYCSKVGHKYRKCFQREKAEAEKKRKKGNGDQGNQTKQPGRTQIVQELPAETKTVKEGAGNTQNATGVPPRSDLYFSETPTSPQCPNYAPISPELNAQLNSIREEMRDFRVATMNNQVNSVSVSELNMDDSDIIHTLLEDTDYTFDDLELDPSPVQKPTTESGPNDDQKRKLITLTPGEEMTLNSSESPTQSKPKFSGVRPSKPTIWALLLTIILFMSFWSQGLAKQTSAAIIDLHFRDTPLSVDLGGSIFDPTHLWACFLFLSEGPYLVSCAKAGLCEVSSVLTCATRSVCHVVFAAFHNRDPFYCLIELSVHGVKVSSFGRHRGYYFDSERQFR
ncbi:MAG: hypothetical protein GY696_37585 [Gammaproteobacteria bacterium]|nr:hypothetical protein [Gammaproteobacteria bacterium]